MLSGFARQNAGETDMPEPFFTLVPPTRFCLEPFSRLLVDPSALYKNVCATIDPSKKVGRLWCFNVAMTSSGLHAKAGRGDESRKTTNKPLIVNKSAAKRVDTNLERIEVAAGNVAVAESPSNTAKLPPARSTRCASANNLCGSGT